MVIEKFKSTIDYEKNYSFDELSKLLHKIYEEEYTKIIEFLSDDEETKPKKKGRPCKKIEKKTRQPSEYNLFIKQKIEFFKKENPSILAKDLMTKAASEWSKKTTK